jgi:hypothetical protein
MPWSGDNETFLNEEKGRGPKVPLRSNAAILREEGRDLVGVGWLAFPSCTTSRVSREYCEPGIAKERGESMAESRDVRLKADGRIPFVDSEYVL